MSQSNPFLPPGCVLRQADPRDRLEVKKILFQALNWDKIIFVSIGTCIFFAPVVTFALAVQLAMCIFVGALILFIFYQLNILKYWVIECNRCIVAFGALYCHETHRGATGKRRIAINSTGSQSFLSHLIYLVVLWLPGKCFIEPQTSCAVIPSSIL